MIFNSLIKNTIFRNEQKYIITEIIINNQYPTLWYHNILIKYYDQIQFELVKPCDAKILLLLKYNHNLLIFYYNFFG